MQTRLSRRFLSLLVLAIVAAVGLTSVYLHAAPYADPPLQIPYAGYLQQNGAPQNGNVKLDVALYDPMSPSTPFWTDSYATVSVVNGRFTVTLGSTANPIPAGYFNGSVGSGQPVELAVSVNSVALSPHQIIHAVPYAVAAGTANHSAGDFNVNGALMLTNNTSRSISFVGDTGDQPNGITYRNSTIGTSDALSILGAGTTIGQRLVRIFDNLAISGRTIANDIIANGILSVSGSVSAGGGIVPDLDTGWVKVYSDPTANFPPPLVGTSTDGTPYVYRDPATKMIVIDHTTFPFIPSHIALQACANASTGACSGAVTLNSGDGYHDSGTDINPSIAYSPSANQIILSTNSGWWTFAYNNGSWVCPGTPSGNCFSGYYRLLAWR